MANNRKWSCKLADLQQRVAELELIVAQRHKPPSKLGTAIRYLVENQDVIADTTCRASTYRPAPNWPAAARRSMRIEDFQGQEFFLYGGGWHGRWEARKFDHRCDPHVPSLDTVWDSTRVSDGSYMLHAVAKYTSGNYRSSSVFVTVKNKVSYGSARPTMFIRAAFGFRKLQPCRFSNSGRSRRQSRHSFYR